MLEGLALLEGRGDHGGVAFLEDLPRDPKARFALLFGLRDRWLAEDLKPFLRGMTVPPGKQADDVVSARTRTSTRSHSHTHTRTCTCMLTPTHTLALTLTLAYPQVLEHLHGFRPRGDPKEPLTYVAKII